MSNTAKVKPFYKKEINTEPENYKPVSLLPILWKIIDKVVYNQLIGHLEKHDILISIYQYININTYININLVFEANTQ